MAEQKTYRPFLDVLTEGRDPAELPEGHVYGFKIVRPDLRSYHGFRWPWPGGRVDDPNAVANGNPCPTSGTGGFCVAKTLKGAASGGHGHETVLLLAYRPEDVLAESEDKLRAGSVLVLDILDGRVFYRKAVGADLAGAYLVGTDLAGANLAGADLAGANLAGADLARTDLAGADLVGAYLAGAYLVRAYLAGANLAGADLARANLARANLAGADLAGADLARADLAGANLARADLAGANLAGAQNLDKAIGYMPVTADG